jgi:TolB-like protein/DNA-binding winged helix-turn-helix (wHTH) protein/Tfp pilus assembly protein PilF
VKLDAVGPALHGLALVDVWFVSDPHLISAKRLIQLDIASRILKSMLTANQPAYMPSPSTTRFDGWVLRMDVGELAKDGQKIRLQDQPLQILDELLNRPGELVTRERLIARLWPKGVVDFDTGLNSAVRKLRIALQDEADTPRYIETVPRKGYRFVGTIEPPAIDRRQAVPPIVPIVPAETRPLAEPPIANLAPPPAGRTDTSEPQPPAAGYRRTHIYVLAGVAALLIAALSAVVLRRESVPTTLQPATESVRVPLDSRTIAVLPFRTSADDEVSEVVAQSVTDLIRNRLAALEGLVVIAGTSTSPLADSALDANAIARKLHARFLMQGSIARSGDQLRMEVQLLDAASGSRLWSTAFDRSATDAAVVLEEIVGSVADAFHIGVEPTVSDASAPARINLDAYELYVRGQQLMSNLRVEDANVALELFRRATILDPTFARGYLALAQAHILAAALRGRDDATAAEMEAQANTALGRSLELNPALGEAWIERARLTKDPASAEELFRKGLQLAPSYGMGYMRYAEFLFGEYRKGEAIETMDRARQIDPLTPRLHLRQAFFLMVARSDIAGHDRLVREALAINPNLNPALVLLAGSRHEYSGEFADAADIIERSIALDPQSDEARATAATIYLDLDDPVAAKTVLRDLQQPSPVLVEMAQYQGDRRRAAELARSAEWWEGGPRSPLAEAIRDDAIVTGDYASALKLLESRYATGTTGVGLRMSDLGLGLVYAHTLILAGETQRGRKLATAILMQIDSESVGRTENWFSGQRATVFAMLGEDERVFEELAASQKLNHYAHWWYTAELDPVFDRLRRDPRFQALAEQAKQHRIRQRALVEEMRRSGEIPKRDS